MKAKDWASLAAAGLLLAGCASAPRTPIVIEAPAPEQTPNVMRVRGTVLPVDPSIKLETAFAEFGACSPGSQQWAEVDPGRVQFSCTYDDGTIIQFDFTAEAGNPVAVRQFTFTSMNDAEFAGVSLRGPDAEEALKNVYLNEPLF